MSQRVIILVLTIVACSAVAVSQALPDPRSTSLPPVTAPDPYGLTKPNLTSVSTSQVSGAPDPAIARALAERVVSGLDGLSDTVRKNMSMITRLKSRMVELNANQAKLQRDRARVLDELKKGFYCSTCNRAKSEFESDAHFWAHIREGAEQGRRAVPASAEQVRNKMQEFDQKLQSLQNEQQKCWSAIQEKNDENRLAYNQIQEGINLWQAATAFHKSALAVSDELNKRRLQEDTLNAKKEIARLDREIAGSLKRGLEEQRQILESEKQTWQGVLRRLTEESNNRIDYYWQNMREADAKQQSEFELIRGYIGRTDDFLYSQRQAANFIPTLSVSIAGVGVFTSPDQLGLRFNFGNLVKGGLDSSNGSANQEVQAFLDLFGTLRFGAGWQTTYGLSGVQSGPTGYVGLRPKPRATTLKINKRIIDEKPRTKLPIP